MRSILKILILSLFFAHCSDVETAKPEPGDQTTNKDVADSVFAKSFKRCYQTNVNKNEVIMNLEITDTLVTGDLTYAIAEKDKNQGSFSGTLIGDTLTADYRFMSEGVESVRQITYLVSDSFAVEGYGKMEQKEGRMIFSGDAKPEFGKGIILQRMNCKN